jgi:hypothetical protein
MNWRMRYTQALIGRSKPGDFFERRAPEITGKHMKNKKVLMSSLVATLVLAGCGGGGGGSSGGSSAAAANSASSPSAATASSPAVASEPTVAGEQLPSLTSPQPGSTAATGNGVQGIWSSASGIDKSTAFIDTQNNLSYVDATSVMPNDEFFGAITTATPNWTLTSGDYLFGNIYWPTTSGSGTFTSGQAFSGSYVADNDTHSFSWTYDPANALAVSQSSVTGTWSETNASLTVAADGTTTGTLSGCPVSGTLVLATPSSSQNLYTLSVTGTTSSGCLLQSGTTYSGSAAFVFEPISGSTLYQRTLVYLIRSPNNSVYATGQLTKQ